jgi:hypothetical protein
MQGAVSWRAARMRSRRAAVRHRPLEAQRNHVCLDSGRETRPYDRFLSQSHAFKNQDRDLLQAGADAGGYKPLNCN